MFVMTAARKTTLLISAYGVFCSVCFFVGYQMDKRGSWLGEWVAIGPGLPGSMLLLMDTGVSEAAFVGYFLNGLGIWLALRTRNGKRETPGAK